MTVINAGSLRLDEVRIIGCSYISPVPDEKQDSLLLEGILAENGTWTEKALDLALFLMKRQLFYDGNKRIAMLTANKILISHGCGTLSVSQDKLEEYFAKLVRYYESEEQKEPLKQFLYSYIEGLDI